MERPMLSCHLYLVQTQKKGEAVNRYVIIQYLHILNNVNWLAKTQVQEIPVCYKPPQI